MRKSYHINGQNRSNRKKQLTIAINIVLHGKVLSFSVAFRSHVVFLYTKYRELVTMIQVSLVVLEEGDDNVVFL